MGLMSVRRGLLAAVVVVAMHGLALTAEPGPVDKNAPEEFTTTKSGLKYRIRRQSDGDKPRRANTCVAHYRGWLDDGTEFDSSYKSDMPITFTLKQVINGWIEGIQLVGKGGMIELDVPPELAYGKNQKGDIPPNSRLHFLIELLDIQ